VTLKFPGLLTKRIPLQWMHLIEAVRERRANIDSVRLCQDGKSF
jgi:hypothetical protein